MKVLSKLYRKLKQTFWIKASKGERFYNIWTLSILLLALFLVINMFINTVNSASVLISLYVLCLLWILPLILFLWINICVELYKEIKCWWMDDS